MRTRSALIAAALSLACARAERAPARGCDAAFDHVDALLRSGLETYVEGMKRYAAARDPEVTTAAAETRVRARADAWSAAHRAPVVGACRGWSEERYRCVLAAADAPSLNGCGLEPVVRSFTDEVVSEFAARPLAMPPSGETTPPTER
jgi:hypothetical protein